MLPEDFEGYDDDFDDDFEEVPRRASTQYYDISRDADVTPHAPRRFPRLGSSDLEESAQDQSHIETEPVETQTHQHDPSSDTMAAFVRMPHTLDPNEITIKGEIFLSVLRELGRKLNKYREENGLEKIDIPKSASREKLYNFLKDYIDLKNSDGSDYVEIRGKGEPLIEIVEQNPPILEYDDVKNDP